MPSSMIFVGLVVMWLLILVPAVARRRQEVARPSVTALSGRVLERSPRRDPEPEREPAAGRDVEVDVRHELEPGHAVATHSRDRAAIAPAAGSATRRARGPDGRALTDRRRMGATAAPTAARRTPTAHRARTTAAEPCPRCARPLPPGPRRLRPAGSRDGRPGALCVPAAGGAHPADPGGRQRGGRGVRRCPSSGGRTAPSTSCSSAIWRTCAGRCGWRRRSGSAGRHGPLRPGVRRPPRTTTRATSDPTPRVGRRSRGPAIPRTAPTCSRRAVRPTTDDDVTPDRGRRSTRWRFPSRSERSRPRPAAPTQRRNRAMTPRTSAGPAPAATRRRHPRCRSERPSSRARRRTPHCTSWTASPGPTTGVRPGQ